MIIGLSFFAMAIPFRFHYSVFEQNLLVFGVGLKISIFFSLVSLGVYYSFRRHLASELTTPLRFFIIQFSFLFIVFAMVFVSMYYIIPALR